MAEKKKTISKTVAPKRARKSAEITTDDGVTLDDGVTTRDNTMMDDSVKTSDSHIVVEATRADVSRYVAEATNDVIAQRAYERFVARGYEHGHDLEDWLAAEAEARV